MLRRNNYRTQRRSRRNGNSFSDRPLRDDITGFPVHERDAAEDAYGDTVDGRSSQNFDNPDTFVDGETHF